jgi:hypothetical protein
LRGQSKGKLIMRRLVKTIVALVGEVTPQFVAVDTGLTVKCEGQDVWAFRQAYIALPLVVECGGARYYKSAFNSFRQEAYYHG